MFENGAPATIWKLYKPNDKGTSMKARIGISQKRGDKFVTQYSGIVYFCNDSIWSGDQRTVIPTIENLLALVPDARNRDVSFDDEDMPRNMAPKIRLKHVGTTRTFEDSKDRRFDFVFDFEERHYGNNSENTSNKPAPPKRSGARQNGDITNIPDPDLEELPFA